MPDTHASLRADIAGQPDALRAFLDSQGDNAARIAKAVQRAGIDYVLIAGRGSSDNAARYAHYLFGAEHRLPVATATPSLFTRYGTPPRLDGALVIAVSQSGASLDVVEVVSEARRQGRPTVGITNTPGSPLAEASQHVLHLEAGDETGPTATKTYVNSLAAFALLSAVMHRNGGLRDELDAIPELLRKSIDTLDGSAAAKHLGGAGRASVIGRGFNYATAHEIALQLTALTGASATPYSAADFLRGPMASLGAEVPALLIATSGRVLSDVVDLIPTLRARGVGIVTVTDVAELRSESDETLLVPSVREWLSPLTAIIPGQLIALAMAAADAGPSAEPARP